MHNTIKIVFAIVLASIVTTCSNTKKDKSTTKTEKLIQTISTPQQKALEERKESFNKSADENTKKIYLEGLNTLSESDILKTAKNVGDTAPDFSLKNALGKDVSLHNYLQNGPVVLVWYRGGWCPYCNINLRYLQEELPNIKALGAQLIALTPELPDESLNTSEKLHLDFEILSDIGNKVAKDYGVVFKLTDDVAHIYNEKFSLNQHNGDNSNELPLAATYIITKEGKIVYSFLNTDYRKRAEPSTITDFLRKING